MQERVSRLQKRALLEARLPADLPVELDDRALLEELEEPVE